MSSGGNHGKRGGHGGFRGKTTRVKTARKRSNASTRWLQRQLNDPYVQRAQQEGYRSRAAYKLLELNEKLKFLKPGMQVVDLGAAPGGWLQVALQHIGPGGKVVGIDLLEIDPLEGATILQGDFTETTQQEAVLSALGGGVDCVLSDMAPNTTGHAATDHLRIIALCEEAYAFARHTLKPGGHFITKVWQGGATGELLQDIRAHFRKVQHVKPASSRKESPELFLAALDFKGNPVA